MPESTQLMEQDPSGAFLAVVKKDFLKAKNGGKGAGKKGDKEAKGGKKGKPRVCYKCGAEDHTTTTCLVRLKRVAAGGPERLPQDDVM